jgi:Trypsin
MIATAPSASATQLRGGGSASDSTDAKDPRVKELAPPPNVEADADASDARDLAVRPTDRKPYFVQGTNGCAGALVAPDMVLTSASCADKYFGPAAPTTVIVGSNKLGTVTAGAERLSVVAGSAVTHPDWDPRSLRGNLMLFKIQPATMNAPLELSPSSWDYFNFDRAITTYGFGRVTPTGGAASRSLLRVDLVPTGTMEEVLSRPDCDDWVLHATNRTAVGVSCGYAEVFNHPLSDACQASTGAPVVDPWGKLVGVASFDDACAEIGADYSRLAYTSVAAGEAYRPWLEHAICSLSASRTYCPPSTAQPTSAPVSSLPPPPRGGWTDGAVCGLGTTCNQCMSRATFWISKGITACGVEPCWPRRTLCAAGTTCNQCCHGSSWKVEDFLTSCN